METQIVLLEGIEFITPVGFKFPTEFLKDCPDCCGPNSAIWQLSVPESLFGLRISPACMIHDECWNVVEPTWAGFHQSNSIFMTNGASMILARTRFGFVKRVRIYGLASGYILLTFGGAPLFWAYKRRQMVQNIASNLSSSVKG
ncbi:MAG: hypothetical protein EHM49_04200 [Deltaproteobacteria bacterium]|nr:MAG: hypothetical protein EHM49_04200 [Deltaproteobacteria bacterium]